MPAEGIDLTAEEQLLTTEETLQLARRFVELGVNKIRLTGGEPTVRKDLVDVVAALAAIPGLRTLAMTSNGMTLTRSKLQSLRDAGLSHLNLSLDTLHRDRFEAVSRRPPSYWDRAYAAITHALELGYAPLKVNCVAMRGVNDDEVGAFAALTRDLPLDVRFIELMPFAGNEWTRDRFMPYADILAALQAQLRLGPGDLVPVGAPDAPAHAAPTGASDAAAAAPEAVDNTARMYRIRGHVGRVGVIASMTAAFCGSCTRLRLTADGNVKACLHGREEVSLRALLRAGHAPGGPAITAAIAAAVQGKHFALGGHAGVAELQRTAHSEGSLGRAMIRIGG